MFAHRLIHICRSLPVAGLLFVFYGRDKKSVTNTLRHGLTNSQATVIIRFLKNLIAFKRTVVELIEDFGKHVPLER